MTLQELNEIIKKYNSGKIGSLFIDINKMWVASYHSGDDNYLLFKNDNLYIMSKDHLPISKIIGILNFEVLPKVNELYVEINRWIDV